MPAKPIHILHLIDTTGPGGAETVFTTLLRSLDSDRYQHTVVLRGEGWVADTVREIGIEPLIIDSKGSFNLGYIATLLGLIRKNGITLIHAHLLGSNIYGALAAIVSRVPMIATFHGGADVASKERFLATKFRLINIGAKAIVCVSRRLQEELGARSPLATKKLRLIYNGVDPEKFQPRSGDALKKELGLAADTKIVISIGNIRPAKGYPYLVDAVADVVAQDPGVHFVIVGHQRKDLFSQLEAQIEQVGVGGNIHFLGFRSDVQDLLCQADVFLLPSTSEGFSISTVEAMMAGIPVVSTRSGGPEEILDHDKTGILIPVADRVAISHAVLRVVRGEIPENMNVQARDRAKQSFSVRAMLDHYEALYQELV
ncbi:glycosyltransferase family 4 protein [Marinobacter sp.]|uniref:glycosyltransferase family 4 protein n=1 Tax=Marinobacter sp. TaxID=50741 RepID=UPI0035615735